jgi:Leucine-rich repeat (LRR) protein
MGQSVILISGGAASMSSACRSDHPTWSTIDPRRSNMNPLLKLSIDCRSNPMHLRAINKPCLRRLRNLTLRLSSTQKSKAAATFGSLLHGENWSGLDELALWSPDDEGFIVPDLYLDLFLHSPLLTTIKSLRIVLHVTGLERLIESPQARHLRSLDVTLCYLREVGRVLSGAVFRDSLEHLDLSLNNLEDDGVRELMIGNRWPRLHSLDLGCNNISDEGVQYLLPVVHQLDHLELHGGSITDSGARALANAIDPDKLTSLCLSYNPLSPEMVQILRDRFGKRFRFVPSEK